MKKLKYRILYKLWVVWHSRLRDVFDLRVVKMWLSRRGCSVAAWFMMRDYYKPASRIYGWAHDIDHKYTERDRPFYHLCCNGNNGGWRTNLCDWLEGKWRALEDELRGY